MARNLHLFFDGTWQRSDQQQPTNVALLHRNLAANHQSYYQPGVGTGLFHFTGGLLGFGLSQDIIDAYRWLLAVRATREDVLTVVGYSRGAYAARSLCGMLWRVGLRRDVPADTLFSHYKDRIRDARTPTAVHASPRVSHLLVFDTVGALGIPTPIGYPWTKAAFHDTRPSPIIRLATHLVALHETRRHFVPTLFDTSDSPETRVHELWSPGTHVDIGGGGENTSVSNMNLNYARVALEHTGSTFTESFKRDLVLSLLGQRQRITKLRHRWFWPEKPRQMPKHAYVVPWFR